MDEWNVLTPAQKIAAGNRREITETVWALQQRAEQAEARIAELEQALLAAQSDAAAVQQERDAWQHLSTLQDDLLASYRVGRLHSQGLIERLQRARDRVAAIAALLGGTGEGESADV